MTAPKQTSSLNAEGLAASARRASKGRGPAPVHLWNPPFCGDLDIRIARDGTWYYLGTPIGRPELVRLFASILKREGDDYFLVTPVEKVGIIVDDAPFIAVDFEQSGQGSTRSLRFTTNLEEQAVAGPDHEITVILDETTGEPAPYVHIRSGLHALIDRKSFYRLVELGETYDVDGVAQFGLWSSGQFFPIIEAAALPS